MSSSRAKGLANAVTTGASNAQIFLEGLQQFLGNKGARQILEQVAPPRSAVQDVMQQTGSYGAGMRELPVLPSRSVKPEFGGGMTRRPEPGVPSGNPSMDRFTGGPRVRTMPSAAEAGKIPQGPAQNLPPELERFEALRQMNLDLRNPAGAVNPNTGKGMGGQYYSGKSSSAADRDLVRGSFQADADRDVMDIMEAGRRSQPSRVAEGQMNIFDQEMRPRGITTTDLSKADIRDAILAGALGIAGGAAGMMMGGGQEQAPVGTSIQDRIAAQIESAEPRQDFGPSGDIDLTGLGDIMKNYPRRGRPMDQSTEAREIEEFVANQPMGEEAAAVNELISEVLQAVQSSGAEASERVKAAAPRDPSTYKNIGDYYADRRRFVESMQGGEFKENMKEAVAEESPQMTPENIMEFVQSNPTLAYELMMRGQGERPNPMLSEQTSEQITTETVGSSLGDDNVANALGQANAAADNVQAEMMGGTLEGAARAQQNNEIIDASRPIVRPQLQPTKTFLEENVPGARMAGSSEAVGRLLNIIRP